MDLPEEYNGSGEDDKARDEPEPIPKAAGFEISDCTAHLVSGCCSSRTASSYSDSRAMLPKTLQVGIDSRPLVGAGRVEDTFNLLGHAARKVVRCASKLTGLSPENICSEAGCRTLTRDQDPHAALHTSSKPPLVRREPRGGFETLSSVMHACEFSFEFTQSLFAGKTFDLATFDAFGPANRFLVPSLFDLTGGFMRHAIEQCFGHTTTFSPGKGKPFLENSLRG